MDAFDAWQSSHAAPALEKVRWGPTELRLGQRVRLAPGGDADIFDLVLKGKIATIASIEQDFEGIIHLAVTVDDDPGRDFGEMLQLGHRFFFKLDEVEPLDEKPGSDLE